MWPIPRSTLEHQSSNRLKELAVPKIRNDIWSIHMSEVGGGLPQAGPQLLGCVGQGLCPSLCWRPALEGPSWSAWPRVSSELPTQPRPCSETPEGLAWCPTGVSCTVTGQ